MNQSNNIKKENIFIRRTTPYRCEAAGGEILRRRSSDSLPRSWNWVRDCVQV